MKKLFKHLFIFSLSTIVAITPLIMVLSSCNKVEKKPKTNPKEVIADDKKNKVNLLDDKLTLKNPFDKESLDRIERWMGPDSETWLECANYNEGRHNKITMDNEYHSSFFTSGIIFLLKDDFINLLNLIKINNNSLTFIERKILVEHVNNAYFLRASSKDPVDKKKTVFHEFFISNLNIDKLNKKFIFEFMITAKFHEGMMAHWSAFLGKFTFINAC